MGLVDRAVDAADQRLHFLPCLIAAALSFMALGKQSFAFYEVLRPVVTATACVLVWLGVRRQSITLVWIFLIIGFAFNPISPLKMSRDEWESLNILAGVAFLIAAAVGSTRVPDR